jgi:hypothetical protein
MVCPSELVAFWIDNMMSPSIVISVDCGDYEYSFPDIVFSPVREPPIKVARPLMNGVRALNRSTDMSVLS